MAVHHALDLWESRGRIDPPEQVGLWFKEEWDSMYASLSEQWPDSRDWMTGGRKRAENDIADRFNLGVQQVLNYVRWAQTTADEWRPLELVPGYPAVEVPFLLDFEGINVMGFIDLIVEMRDGSFRVRDLKTGTKLPASGLQLGIYALAAEKLFDIRITTGDFFMFKNMTPTPAYDLTRYDLPTVGKWFNNLDRGIEDKVFVPNPGDHCRVCPVSDYCVFGGNKPIPPRKENPYVQA